LYKKIKVNEDKFAEKVSNGYSPANLANSSTCQKFAIFGKFEYCQNGLFEKLVGLAKFAFICQPGLLGLARLANIRQPSFL
jgi:hypothetical protein